MTDSINSLQEQIKSFNKKLANNKVDTELIMTKKNNEIELYLSSVKMDMREIEKLLSKGLDKGIQIDELESV
jgi:hypothetical protein